jgi:hypothetical protein
MKWLLEPETFQEDEQPLMEALFRCGVRYTSVKFGTPYKDYISVMGNEPTVFHGSLQFGKLIQETPLHSVKVFCTLPKYECVYYYPRIKGYLLNFEYIMLPFGDLSHRKHWLFDKLNRKGSLFVRPSSGYKTFTGLVISDSEWEMELKFLQCQVNPEELVVVAPAQEVIREWRTVVVQNQVITAGQYRECGENVRIREVPEKVLHFAQEVVDFSGYTPDKAWTLDVCENSFGALNVVEANSFSCAGLYACDYEAIVRAINSIT